MEPHGELGGSAEVRRRHYPRSMCVSRPLVRNGSTIYHVITPGDHYSPETGSAIPTVVHGLATAAARGAGVSRFPQHVVVQSGTYAHRYLSAEALEYRGGPPPTRRERMMDAGLGRLGMQRRFAARAYCPVAEVLRSAPPGIVVAHNGAALVRLLGHTDHRIVLYAHNNLFRSYSSAEASRIAEACDRIICVSRFLRDDMAQRVSRRSRDHFRVVTNGVDTEQFTPGPLRRSVKMRVAFIGRVVPEKGPDVLLRAAERLQRDDMEFTIIGSKGFDRNAPLSRYEQELRQLAGQDKRVHFEPFTDRADLPEKMQNFDVLVVPSRWPEPWALTAGEGMASGLAVIAASVGGLPEQIGDAGILVAPGDPNALARALSMLADDRGACGELGEVARERALRQDWSASWAEFERLLSELAAKSE